MKPVAVLLQTARLKPCPSQRHHEPTLLLARLHLPEIYSCCLRADVDGCRRFQRAQINHFDRTWLFADTLDGDECIAIIGRNNCAVHYLSLRGYVSQFLAT